MATMIPQRLSDDTPKSELDVFELLERDPAAERWTVLHSQRPSPAYSPGRGRGGRRRREIDFLVLIPDVGILCLEVKGGSFRVENGEWYPGASTTPTEPPVSQAQTAMYDMRNELVGQFSQSWGNAELPIECAVIFTDTVWPSNARAADRPVVSLPELHQQGSSTLAERLLDIARTARGEIRNAAPLQFDTTIVQQIVEHRVPGVILPEVFRPVPYRRAEGQLSNLTAEQHQALEITKSADRCLFQGAAGTGKTMLAIEQAQRRSQAGDRVALICYNRILGDWLSNEVMTGSRFRFGNLAGSFWHHFAYSIISWDARLNAEFSAAMDAAANNEERYGENGICQDFLRRALQQSGPQFDYLVVDELQDMCQDPYLDIMDLALRGGLENGKWAIFADFEQQAVNQLADDRERNSDSDIRHLDEYAVDTYSQATLSVNCRNTLQIIQDVVGIAGAVQLDDYQNRIAGPLPSYEAWRDEEQLRALLERDVAGLVRQNEQVADIFVLGIRPLSHSGLSLFGYSYHGYNLYDCPGIYWPPRATCDQNPCCQVRENANTHLKFREVRRFKGMESKIIILIVDRLTLPADWAALYVGMTRARINLIVLAHESAVDALTARIGRDGIFPVELPAQRPAANPPATAVDREDSVVPAPVDTAATNAVPSGVVDETFASPLLDAAIAEPAAAQLELTAPTAETPGLSEPEILASEPVSLTPAVEEPPLPLPEETAAESDSEQPELEQASPETPLPESAPSLSDSAQAEPPRRSILRRLLGWLR